MVGRQKNLIAASVALTFEPRNPEAPVSTRAAWNLWNKSGGIKSEYKAQTGDIPCWIGPSTKEEPKLGPEFYTDSFIVNQCALTNETMASVNREGFGKAFVRTYQRDIAETCGIQEAKTSKPTQSAPEPTIKRGRGRPKGSKGKAVSVSNVVGSLSSDETLVLKALLAKLSA